MARYRYTDTDSDAECRDVATPTGYIGIWNKRVLRRVLVAV